MRLHPVVEFGELRRHVGIDEAMRVLEDLFVVRGIGILDHAEGLLVAGQEPLVVLHAEMPQPPAVVRALRGVEERSSGLVGAWARRSRNGETALVDDAEGPVVLGGEDRERQAAHRHGRSRRGRGLTGHE